MAQVVVLTGDVALNRKLAALKGPQAKAIIRKAAREALRPVHAAAKANAPKRTGKLSRSVRLRAIKRSRVRIGAMVTTNASDNVKGKTYYGGFQEYGWKTGRRASNKDLGVAAGKKRTEGQKAEIASKNAQRRQVPGKKFMKQAADEKRQMALSIYELEIEAGLVKLAQGS